MAPVLSERKLGQQGLRASAQGLGPIACNVFSRIMHCVISLSRCKASSSPAGCMGMSTAYKDTKNPVSDEESSATIHRALELGVTFLDTSDMYGPFTNEELVGMHLANMQLKFYCLCLLVLLLLLL